MTVKRFFVSLITAAFLLMPAAAYAAEDMNTADENEIIIPESVYVELHIGKTHKAESRIAGGVWK